MLQEVCEDLNVTCLGYLPKQKELEQESRHLGLDFSRSKETEGLDMLAGLLEEHVDWELLLSTTGRPLPTAAVEEKPVLSEPGKLHISVARNEESFSFLYAEHLDILRRMGTVTFSIRSRTGLFRKRRICSICPAAIPRTVWRNLPGQGLPGSLSAAI